MWGQLSTTCCNLLKRPNDELLVAVGHNQLCTMVSQTVEQIDWSHPPPSWTVPPELHVLHGVIHGLQITRLAVATGAQTRIHGYARPVGMPSMGMPWVCPHRPACAASQGKTDVFRCIITVSTELLNMCVRGLASLSSNARRI